MHGIKRRIKMGKLRKRKAFVFNRGNVKEYNKRKRGR